MNRNEVTEGVTEHPRCSVCARGISGYSTTFFQTCRKRGDELLGEHSRVAEGTDNLFMGSSRRSGATTMFAVMKQRTDWVVWARTSSPKREASAHWEFETYGRVLVGQGVKGQGQNI